MEANSVNWVFKKFKYHILILFLSIVVLVSSLFFNSSLGGKDKIVLIYELIKHLWLQMIIVSFIITFLIYGFVQYTMIKSIKELKDERSKIKEKAEIHNMRLGVRRQ